jgi:hypothetical protein
MRAFYFNSGVKPWNTNVEYHISKGNKFINGELHHLFMVDDSIPEGSKIYCLGDKCLELYGSNNNFIVAEVVGGNMLSKYAVFYNN